MADLKQVVATVLMIPLDSVKEDLEYNSIPEWDSVAHMALVAELEETYGIMLDTDDIVGMSSIGKIRETLKKYDVTV